MIATAARISARISQTLHYGNRRAHYDDEQSQTQQSQAQQSQAQQSQAHEQPMFEVPHIGIRGKMLIAAF